MEEYRLENSGNNTSTEIFNKTNWPEIKTQVTELIKDCFPQYNFTNEEIENFFLKTYSNDKALVLFLKDKLERKIIGFTATYINGDTADIHMTGIRSDKRNQKLVGELMKNLEEKLKTIGVSYITREAKVNDGYADAIERYYGDRVIYTEDIEGTKGGTEEKRSIKIKL
jgi:ribosomal protein S18 acetylase RimI-like enzyme